jgi:hypothetical protein
MVSRLRLGQYSGHSVLASFNLLFFLRAECNRGPGSSVGIATGWLVRGSNPGGGEIFHTCPYRPWGQPSLLYKGYRVFPGGRKRPGRDADLSPLLVSSKNRVQIYLYSPSGPSWPVKRVKPILLSTITNATSEHWASNVKK